MVANLLKPPGISDEVWQDALWRFWIGELNAVDTGGQRPDWYRRRIAAREVCKLIGLDQLVQALSADGMLRPPPKWPEVDCVPVGGGPGLILCDVRTLYEGRKHSVRIGLHRAEHITSAKAFDKNQIGAALDRGRFELRRKIGE